MSLQGVALVAITTYALGLFLGWAIFSSPRKQKLPIEEAENGRAMEAAEAPIDFDDFTVTGKPRKPTWRQRRKELEAAARTKRKRLEEWRD
jgi:hypothetical protein